MTPPPVPQKVGRRWRRVVAEVLLFAAIFVGVQWWQARGAASGPVPPLDGHGLDGAALSTEALRGKPALVHFWATWCEVCRAEEGNIASLAANTPMITVATSSGDAARVRAYLDQRGVKLPVIVDPEGEIAARFGVRAFPTTFVVDGKGEIRSAVIGYTTTLGMRLRLWLAR